MSDRTVQHDTLVIDRTFDAESTRVFAAWASPEARKQWAVPDDGWEIADDQDDFRVGGHEVSHFGPPGDPRYRAETNYFDIIDNARIVMAGAMYDRDARISVSLATVEFSDRRKRHSGDLHRTGRIPRWTRHANVATARLESDVQGA